MEQFNIPVVLFCFKRTDTTKRVLEAIRKVQPRKMYILADQGRTAQEKEMAAACRNMVESEIDWPCEVIKNYAAENRGVYKNIGLGAKWVFEREAEAIFLEDDCLPDITFFSYCKQLLEHYRENTSASIIMQIKMIICLRRICCLADGPLGQRSF